VYNLPKVVTWQCPGSESNLQPQGYKFGTLPLDYQATQDYEATSTMCCIIAAHIFIDDGMERKPAGHGTLCNRFVKQLVDVIELAATSVL